jgi:glyoxylase-like metal-dependent hydrolase (beta-lactamase superfamily II)
MRKAAASAKIVVKSLRNNISVLMGSGGNIAVLTGKDGKLLIDSGFAVSRTGITNALAGINPDPIKRLINTHWHVDHTDGNEWVHAAGAEYSRGKDPRTSTTSAFRCGDYFPARTCWRPSHHRVRC